MKPISILMFQIDKRILLSFFLQIGCQMKRKKLKYIEMILTDRQDGCEAIQPKLQVLEIMVPLQRRLRQTMYGSTIRNRNRAGHIVSKVAVSLTFDAVLSKHDPISEFSCYDLMISQYN